MRFRTLLARSAALMALTATPVTAQTLTYSGDFEASDWWTLNEYGPRNYPLVRFNVGGGGWDVESIFIEYLMPRGQGANDDLPELQLDYLTTGTTVVHGFGWGTAHQALGQSATDPSGGIWDLYRLTLDQGTTIMSFWSPEAWFLPAGEYQMYLSPYSDPQYRPLVHATSGGANAVNATSGLSEWNNGNNPYALPGYEFVFGVTGTERPLEPSSTVPEPATMTLLATGMAGLAAARRRRKH